MTKCQVMAIGNREASTSTITDIQTRLNLTLMGEQDKMPRISSIQSSNIDLMADQTTGSKL